MQKLCANVYLLVCQWEMGGKNNQRRAISDINLNLLEDFHGLMVYLCERTIKTLPLVPEDITIKQHSHLCSQWLTAKTNSDAISWLVKERVEMRQHLARSHKAAGSQRGTDQMAPNGPKFHLGE